MRAYKSRQDKASQSRAVANQVQCKSDREIMDPSTQLKRLPWGKYQTSETAQLDEDSGSQQNAIASTPNHTGMSDHLKNRSEYLSGFDMSDVRVHYNSDKPAQLQAHAYAQGSQIYLGPGQERHLGHEAWHVVQQKQGRVKPTVQMKGRGGNVGVNKKLPHAIAPIQRGIAKTSKAKRRTSASNRIEKLKRLYLGEATGTFSFNHIKNRRKFRKRGAKLPIYVTNYDSREDHLKKYGSRKSKLRMIHGMGAKTAYNIDATKINQKPEFKNMDVIHFNFPHTGGRVHRNKDLIKGFFDSAAEVQKVGGIVRMGLRLGATENVWDGGVTKRRYPELIQSANKNSYQLLSINHFNEPGYSHADTKPSKAKIKVKQNHRQQIESQAYEFVFKKVQNKVKDQSENAFSKEYVETLEDAEMSDTYEDPLLED